MHHGPRSLARTRSLEALPLQWHTMSARSMLLTLIHHLGLVMDTHSSNAPSWGTVCSMNWRSDWQGTTFLFLSLFLSFQNPSRPFSHSRSLETWPFPTNVFWHLGMMNSMHTAQYRSEPSPILHLQTVVLVLHLHHHRRPSLLRFLHLKKLPLSRRPHHRSPSCSQWYLPWWKRYGHRFWDPCHVCFRSCLGKTLNRSSSQRLPYSWHSKYPPFLHLNPRGRASCHRCSSDFHEGGYRLGSLISQSFC